MLRSWRDCAQRCALAPRLPTSRSNTTRVLFSVGSGVVGVLHDSVFRYTQLYALSHMPASTLRSIESSSDGSTVSLPSTCAASWSAETPHSMSAPSVRLQRTPVSQAAFAFV